MRIAIRAAVFGGLIVVFMALGGSTRAGPATFVVTKTADQTGACTLDNCTLRSAINAANAAGGPATIELPVGEYKITIPGDDDVGAKGDFDVLGDITIVGSGRETTIIDADHKETGFSVSVGASLTLRGLTVKNGGSEGALAGNIYSEGTLVLNDVSIVGGEADEFGAGGVYARGPTTITDSTILKNFAEAHGRAGGVYGEGSLTIERTTITANSIASEGVAGGLFAAGEFFGRDFVVSNNQANGDDVTGGIRLASYGAQNRPSATLERVTVEENTGEGPDSVGGILSNAHTTASDLIVRNNHAPDDTGTGGLYQVIGSLNIDRALIADNDGDGAGGLWLTAPSTLTNTTIEHNTVTGDGTGGLVAGNPFSPEPMTITLINSAITNNDGDGVNNAATLHLTNTILAANLPKNCDGTTPVTDGVNIDSGNTCGMTSTDLPNTDPMLGTLGENGGFVPTRALLDGSPAIDAVDPDDCPPPDTDARNYVRFAGTACDVGPFEADSAAVQMWGDQDCSHAVTGLDALVRLKKAAGISVTLPPGCPDDVQLFLAGKSVVWPDLDCNMTPDAADAAPILAYVAGTPMHPDLCAVIGDTVYPVVQGK